MYRKDVMRTRASRCRQAHLAQVADIAAKVDGAQPGMAASACAASPAGARSSRP